MLSERPGRIRLCARGALLADRPAADGHHVPYPGMDPDKLAAADRLVTSLTKLDVDTLVGLCV